MSQTYSGCVYDAPNTNEFSPVNVDDLNAGELKQMKLTGLPIKAAHGKYTGDNIGVITDEWSGEDGSKYISFQISQEPKYAAYREGVSQRWYTHLSLGHEVNAKKGMVPLEVSICHLGARKNTVIANPEMSSAEYKALTLMTKTERAAMTDAAPTRRCTCYGYGDAGRRARAHHVPGGAGPRGHPFPGSVRNSIVDPHAQFRLNLRAYSRFEFARVSPL